MLHLLARVLSLGPPMMSLPIQARQRASRGAPNRSGPGGEGGLETLHEASAAFLRRPGETRSGSRAGRPAEGAIERMDAIRWVRGRKDAADFDSGMQLHTR